MKLKGKIAVVIGASGGIGREISMALAEKGVNLILVARKKELLSPLSAKINTLGGKAELLICDLTDKKSMDSLTIDIARKNKHIDMLFNIAGVGVYKKLKDISMDDWKISLDVNVTAPFYLTKTLMPLLRKAEKSYVISTGSGMGKVGLSGRAPYCASKFALRGLMQSLAKEYKKTNVNVILLTLGSVLTSFGPLSVDDKKKKEEGGKQYINPTWLAHNIVTRIENGTLDSEVSIYPKHYYEESKKDKR